MKINAHGVVAFLTTALGLALSPAVLGVLPPKAAAVVVAAGAIYQALSKPAAASTP
jgi:hypothetical protein